MPRVQVEHNGQTYEIDVPEGQDVGSTVADFTASLSTPAPQPVAGLDDMPALQDGPLPEREAPGALDRLGDALSVAGDFAQGTVRDITGADETRGVRRGVGLGARTVAGAIPKTASGIADLASLALGSVSGVDIPVDNVASVNALLDEFFPAPQTLPERAVELGGEALLTGGAGAAGLASRVDDVARVVPSLGDDIARAFTDAPKTFGAAEFSGGAGAQIGGELAQDADAGPVAQTLATLGGGLAGAVAPTTVANTSRRALEQAMRTIEPVTPSGAERRAARELQARAGDPEAAAQAAREAPEGVTGARASEDPNLRRAERRVMEDDPQAADTADEALAGAEARTIEEFAAGAAPGQDPVEWQRQVVTRAAPEGATITAGQPDEMLQEAFNSFREGYAPIRDFAIRTKSLNLEDGRPVLPELLDDAVGDVRVLAPEGVRENIGNWLRANFDDVVRRGEAGEVEGEFTITSGDLLDLRQTVRAEQRRLAKTGQSNPDSAAAARLLERADDAITRLVDEQLPERASTALRELDARYSDFKTVEDAVLRGTPGELTPQNLAQSVKMQSGSRGRIARGDSGDLGTLAEQGRRVADFLGKQGKQDQTLQRTMRDMTPEQAEGARGDLVRELSRRGSRPVDGEPRLNGEKLLKEIDDNRSTLRAAGFTDQDLTRMEQVARRLRMIQSPDPRPDTKLIDDHLSAVAGLVSRVAGAKAARGIVKRTGTGGPGALTLTGFMARLFERAFGDLSIMRAEQLITDAMQPTAEGRELFAALLTRSTAPEIQQVRARRTLNAWATQAASIDNGEE